MLCSTIRDILVLAEKECGAEDAIRYKKSKNEIEAKSYTDLKLDSENTTPDGVFLMTATREGEYYLVKKEMPK